MARGAVMIAGYGMRIRIVMTLGAAMLAGTLAGCESLLQDELYYETYEVKHLTVILLDDKALQRRWQYVSGRPASKTIKFTVAGSQMSMADTVKGFFDYKTNTIYCTKLNFDISGHELFHAIMGRFHEDR
jgi:hypothetical protein